MIMFRRKQRIMEKRKEEAKVAMELERRLKLNRQKIMREFKEKQLHTIEILPAGMFMLNSFANAYQKLILKLYYSVYSMRLI